MSAVYGCHNRGDFKPFLVVQDGWYMDGYTRTPRLAASPTDAKAPCQYRLSTTGKADPKCSGCKRKLDPQ